MPIQAETNDELFSAGLESGRQEQYDELTAGLRSQGYGEDEIEALFDPRPRRKHHRRRASSYRSRSYDPAPKRRGKKRSGRAKTYKQVTRHKKSGLAKIRKWVLPVAAGGTFLSEYMTRSKELFAAGLIAKDSVYDAIMYDIQHFNSADAMTRLSSQAGNILTPTIAGWAVKETGIIGKYSGIGGDLLMGIGIGMAGKAILDPPVNGNGARSQPSARPGNGATMRVTQKPQVIASSPVSARRNMYA